MNPIRLAGVATLIVVVTIAAGASARQLPKPKPITGATVVAVDSWVKAVRSHTPGRADDSVVTVAALSYKDREELNAGLGYFLAGLLSRIYDTKRNPAAKALVDIGHAAGNPDANAFLEQAASLHSDVAAYGDRFPLSAADVPEGLPPKTQELRIGGGMGTTTIEVSEPVAPLLTANRIVLDQDGQVVGQVVASWNWPFARFLLGLVDSPRVELRSRRRPDPVTDPFVAAWYHATAAYMFASGAFGDLTPHLHRAMELLPDDARIVFDRACYAELWGLPMHQALAPDPDAGQRAKGGRSGPPTWTTPGSEPAVRIPPAAKTNAEAERLFRRALEIDPSLIEARVRLARLLQLRGRHDEAAAELKTAVAENPKGVVAFYAHLFSGRAAQALARAGEASRHYQAALAVFPDAQSALLASSQLALLDSDVPGAIAPVARLGARSADSQADPWWQYHLGAGRDADDLLKALWASVPRSR